MLKKILKSSPIKNYAIKNGILSTQRFLSEQQTSKFGYEEVKTTEKQTKVNKVFSDVAETYDLMNDLMSFGLHRLWKEKLIRKISPNPHIKLIDVASGTGDIAFRYLYYLKNMRNSEILNKVTVCDINPDMLEVGKKRAASLAHEENIDFIVSNAEELTKISDSSFDVYTISFGIRNCTRVDKVLEEAYRVLNKGGRLLVMEFSQVQNELFRQIYDSYSFKFIPLTGQLVAGDWNSYQYLVESIRVFPNQNDFSEMMRKAGFKNVTYENLNNGIVAVYSGFKL